MHREVPGCSGFKFLVGMFWQTSDVVILGLTEYLELYIIPTTWFTPTWMSILQPPSNSALYTPMLWWQDHGNQFARCARNKWLKWGKGVLAVWSCCTRQEPSLVTFESTRTKHPSTPGMLQFFATHQCNHIFCSHQLTPTYYLDQVVSPQKVLDLAIFRGIPTYHHEWLGFSKL